MKTTEMNEKKKPIQPYDIIGDIHGHAAELVELLSLLGYTETGGCFRHPAGRMVLFLGDYIDRGPEVRRVIRIVRGMIEGGTALGILGNHEINALRYHQQGPGGENDWLRAHEDTKEAQHRATLDQLATPHREEWRECLEWFAGLPLWLELPGLRAVHAAWFDADIAQLRGHGKLIGDELLRLSRGEDAGIAAMERVLNGLELDLPGGETFKTPDGRERTAIRSRWWEDLRGKHCREAVFPDDPQIGNGAFVLPGDHRAYPPTAPLVFFGHYAVMDGRPAPLADNIACLDYGMGKGGQLTAYRWDGEERIEAGKFFSIPQRTGHG